MVSNMRIKRDYMDNGPLLPAYNLQLEYIAAYDVKQYASDMDCFQLLMERFHSNYGLLPGISCGRRREWQLQQLPLL